MSLPTLTRREAAASGYKAITTGIQDGSESAKSMEADMAGIDAVWIRVGDFHCELGRKVSEIVNADRKQARP